MGLGLLFYILSGLGNNRLGFYDQNRDINPRNPRALTFLGVLLERSLILFTLGQNPDLVRYLEITSNRGV